MRGRVECWRGDPKEAPCLYPAFPPSCPVRSVRGPVSSTRHIARSLRISPTTRSCTAARFMRPIRLEQFSAGVAGAKGGYRQEIEYAQWLYRCIIHKRKQRAVEVHFQTLSQPVIHSHVHRVLPDVRPLPALQPIVFVERFDVDLAGRSDIRIVSVERLLGCEERGPANGQEHPEDSAHPRILAYNRLIHDPGNPRETWFVCDLFGRSHIRRRKPQATAVPILSRRI